MRFLNNKDKKSSIYLYLKIQPTNNRLILSCGSSCCNFSFYDLLSKTSKEFPFSLYKNLLSFRFYKNYILPIRSRMPYRHIAIFRWFGFFVIFFKNPLTGRIRLKVGPKMSLFFGSEVGGEVGGEVGNDKDEMGREF